MEFKKILKNLAISIFIMNILLVIVYIREQPDLCEFNV